ncbi:hypothetical protein EJ05DRAFT_471614 [Pseudovirgaria hyperparasitica]|uniref:Uncharacterized protein n=1 Tax=Pseudovirgaria hyperparasitica TaxID=470096 RepID=A0A6A6WKD3_9PEZI|nr:uncharacterized protein EJ05DRAFT_471614 [Pseudovirgaria hyperparasitica]KAF2762635.1 hypothetical protein EJ05DRAFT_471614 [Pseudovirgaria hyperparasitica]
MAHVTHLPNELLCSIADRHLLLPNDCFSFAITCKRIHTGLEISLRRHGELWIQHKSLVIPNYHVDDTADALSGFLSDPYKMNYLTSLTINSFSLDQPTVLTRLFGDFKESLLAKSLEYGLTSTAYIDKAGGTDLLAKQVENILFASGEWPACYSELC